MMLVMGCGGGTTSHYFFTNIPMLKKYNHHKEKDEHQVSSQGVLHRISQAWNHLGLHPKVV
jgi:hypothetical protein